MHRPAPALANAGHQVLRQEKIVERTPCVLVSTFCLAVTSWRMLNCTSCFGKQTRRCPELGPAAVPCVQCPAAKYLLSVTEHRLKRSCNTPRCTLCRPAAAAQLGPAPPQHGPAHRVHPRDPAEQRLRPAAGAAARVLRRAHHRRRQRARQRRRGLHADHVGGAVQPQQRLATRRIRPAVLRLRCLYITLTMAQVKLHWMANGLAQPEQQLDSWQIFVMETAAVSFAAYTVADGKS